jgi:succinoglycan biosynthesis protein ExoW
MQPSTTSSDYPGIGVVIPFYQRTRGLLRRAIDSVFAQGCAASPYIIVVDDASPIPADDEFRDLSDRLRKLVLIERQRNAGPGAARNRGLDLLPDDTVFVAFLDSDDQWLPGHLKRAIDALETGKDFYFSNYLDLGRKEGAFETRRLIDCGLHEQITGVSGAYTYKEDLCSAILNACPVETSTVVIRRRVFRDLRFRENFRDAYEDLMFWFEAASRKPHVAFSPEIGCRYGEGVNVYRGIQAGSDASIRAIIASTMFRSRVRSSFTLSADQLASIEAKLQANCETLAYMLLHRLRRRQPLLWRDLLNFVRADPAAMVRVPWEMARHSWCALRPVRP